MLPPLFLIALLAQAERKVVAAGNFQSELGCAADWSAECEETRLRLLDGRYHWERRMGPGSYVFKIALDGAWNESYPEENTVFTASESVLAITYVDDDTHAVRAESYAPLQTPLVLSVHGPAGASDTFPLGTPLTLIAAISDDPLDAAPPASGTVRIGGALDGEIALEDGGARAWSATSLGEHVIAASYPGDQSYEPSETELHVHIIQAGLTLVASGPPNGRVDEAMTLVGTASVMAPSALTFAGELVLSENNAQIARERVDGSGSASMRVTFATRGTHVLVLTSAESDVFVPTTATLAIDVRGFTSLALIALQDDAIVAQIATEGVATGEVDLFDGETRIASASLKAGVATFSPRLSDGRHTLFVRYAGDLRHEPATSAAFEVTATQDRVEETPADAAASRAGCAQLPMAAPLALLLRRRPREILA